MRLLDPVRCRFAFILGMLDDKYSCLFKSHRLEVSNKPVENDDLNHNDDTDVCSPFED